MVCKMLCKPVRPTIKMVGERKMLCKKLCKKCWARWCARYVQDVVQDGSCARCCARWCARCYARWLECVRCCARSFTRWNVASSRWCGALEVDYSGWLHGCSYFVTVNPYVQQVFSRLVRWSIVIWGCDLLCNMTWELCQYKLNSLWVV